jgi:hypothetical protein
VPSADEDKGHHVGGVVFAREVGPRPDEAGVERAATPVEGGQDEGENRSASVDERLGQSSLLRIAMKERPRRESRSGSSARGSEPEREDEIILGIVEANWIIRSAGRNGRDADGAVGQPIRLLT